MLTFCLFCPVNTNIFQHTIRIFGYSYSMCYVHHFGLCGAEWEILEDLSQTTAVNGLIVPFHV